MLIQDPRVQLRARMDGQRAGKYLMIHEDDLVQLGGHIEGLAEVGKVWSRGRWPHGELNGGGRQLPHGTPLLADLKKARP